MIGSVEVSSPGFRSILQSLLAIAFFGLVAVPGFALDGDPWPLVPEQGQSLFDASDANDDSDGAEDFALLAVDSASAWNRTLTKWGVRTGPLTSSRRGILHPHSTGPPSIP
jgi:hypothetical protein